MNNDTISRYLENNGDYDFAGNIVKSFENTPHVESEINAFLEEVKQQNKLMTVENIMSVGNRIFILLNKWEKKHV